MVVGSREGGGLEHVVGTDKKECSVANKKITNTY